MIIAIAIALTSLFWIWLFKRPKKQIEWERLGIRFGRETIHSDGKDGKHFHSSTEMFWYWISPDRKKFSINFGQANLEGKFPSYPNDDPSWDAIDKRDDVAILDYLIENYTPHVKETESKKPEIESSHLGPTPADAGERGGPWGGLFNP